MSEYKYDPTSYRSPQRTWSEKQRRFLDEWTYLYYFLLTLPDGREITVEPPFTYDKGSVIRLLFGWLPRDDKEALIAFLIHDWLYEKQMIGGVWITRKEADSILYDLLRHSGMRYTKAKAAYLGVRAGGWAYFNDRAKSIGNTHYL